MLDFISHFPLNHSIVYLAGMALIMAAFVVFFYSSHRKAAIIILLAGGFALRLFMINLDSYVNMWDEQYHALVAKNMMEDPFKPVLLKETLLGYDYKNWTLNHVWLHKQPLFLWMMAGSMKIFGVSAASARIPGLIMSTLMILLIYLIGKRWKDETTGFLGAFLFTTGHYILELVAGLYHTDHNDTAFIFFITASLWAYTEFHFSRRGGWVVLIGVLAAMAVLTKWITGLLVYLFWFVALISDPDKRREIKNYLYIVYALIITCILALPWQIYIHYRFPLEAKWESQYNTRHFFEVIEGHGGNFWYHFNQLDFLYGKHTQWFIIAGSILFWFSIKNKPIRNALIVTTLFVFLFFSIAASKMPAFTLMLAAPVYLTLGFLCSFLFKLPQLKFKGISITKLTASLAICILCFLLFRHKIVVEHHSFTDYQRYSYRGIRTVDNEIFKNLKNVLPSDNYVLFNCRHQAYMQAMFETPYIAYDRQIDSTEIQIIKDQSYNIAVFNDYNLPEYIKRDTTIFIIESEMW